MLKLPASHEEKTLVSRPNYDMRGLLGGDEFRAFISVRMLRRQARANLAVGPMFFWARSRGAGVSCSGTEQVVNNMIRWCVQEICAACVANVGQIARIGLCASWLCRTCSCNVKGLNRFL